MVSELRWLRWESNLTNIPSRFLTTGVELARKKHMAYGYPNQGVPAFAKVLKWLFATKSRCRLQDMPYVLFCSVFGTTTNQIKQSHSPSDRSCLSFWVLTASQTWKSTLIRKS